jgi:hypothetical protein
VGEKRGGIDEARSTEVRWEERIEGDEMSGGKDMGAGEADGGRGQRWLMKCFLFFSFLFFLFLFLLLNLFCTQRKQRRENM